MIKAEEHTRLVYKIYYKYFKNIAESRNMKEDYIQEGMVGLVQAAQRFDPAKEIEFSTFACSYIKGFMLRFNDYVLGRNDRQKEFINNMTYLESPNNEGLLVKDILVSDFKTDDIVNTIAIDECFNTLKPKCREIFKYKYKHQCTSEEVANALGISKSKVNYYMRYHKNYLRKALKL